jgi:hypothetical protein
MADERKQIVRAIEDQLESVSPPFISARDFADGYEAPAYLLDGVIQWRRLYSNTALTGAGKTAVSLTLAIHVAMGKNIGRREVEQGRVAFFAGENPDDIRARLLVTAEAFDADLNELQVYFFDRVFDITRLYEHVAICIERIGGVDLIVIDTAAAFFQGEDENSNTELGGFARDLRRLCDLRGEPCVIVNAHPIKNAYKANLLPRGGGAFLNEVDGNLRLWSDDEGVTELHWCGKFRGPDFEPLSFKVETRTSELVKDSKGRLIPSVVAVPVGDDEQEQLSKSARSDEDAVLETMLNYQNNGSIASWCQHLGWVSESGEPQKSKMHRIIKRLSEDKLTKQTRRKWSLTRLGREEAGRACGIK